MCESIIMKFTDSKKIRTTAYGIILFGLVQFAGCKFLNAIEKCNPNVCTQEKAMLIGGITTGLGMILGLNTYNEDLPQRQQRDNHGRFVSAKKRNEEENS